MMRSAVLAAIFLISPSCPICGQDQLGEIESELAQDHADGDDVPSGWDKIFDPDNDCTVESAKSVITITVPGGDHDLSRRSFINKVNTPLLLKKVTGDFTISAKVVSDFDPTAGGGQYLSAGLVRLS